MAAAEAAPLVKVGGLADVVGSLPGELKKLGSDVRLILPKYASIDTKKYKLKKIISNFEIKSGKKKYKINVWQTVLPGKGVKVYLIDNKTFFGKKDVYHGNNAERFIFFSLAVSQILEKIKFIPDVLHCHDFHSSMIIDIIKASENKKFADMKFIYTIHNLNHQGQTGIETLSTGNLNKDSLAALSLDARDGDINFMAQGIVNADWVNTVSPTYAKEIQTHVYGAGLEKIIKKNKDKISGILNGIDVDFFDPSKDKLIKFKYSISKPQDKVKNKTYLQKQLGLPQDEKKPLVGFVSRLAWQKGVELIGEDLMKLDCQFVFLGTGQKEYEQKLKKLAKKYPNKVSAQIMFDVKLAQQIYAASDIFLMPSRFEPCGLGQMIAMRYGTVPVVRSTGGLADTVDAKVGFKFKKFDEKSLELALRKAVILYHQRPVKWKKMLKNCMKRDFSWNRSAKEYLKLYRK